MAGDHAIEIQIGDEMPDGTVYAGISPNTGKAMYALPVDPRQRVGDFFEALKYAAKLRAHGHKDWRVPTKGELNVLFRNRNAIGGFNETGSRPGGSYWSSSQYDYNTAWAQCFSDGSPGLNLKDTDSSVRCVRG